MVRQQNASRKGAEMKLAWLLLVVGLVALFGYGGAEAACAPGHGLECADLGSFTLELLAPSPIQTTCTNVAVQPAQSGGVMNGPCTVYAYKLGGSLSGDNQLNLLIPAEFLVASASCQQFYILGNGDPTTGFGKGLKSHNTCRVASNLNPPPGVDIGPPPGTNLIIVTSQALLDGTNTLLKSGKSLAFEQILGPGSEVPPIATTTQTVTTGDGITLTVVTDQQGNLVSALAKNPDGSTRPVTIHDLSDLKLDVPGQGSLSLTFVTNNADLKVAGTDPCKIIGARAVCY
jgi:hypothetical protein